MHGQQNIKKGTLYSIYLLLIQRFFFKTVIFRSTLQLLEVFMTITY
jgi:hypothetical protein